MAGSVAKLVYPHNPPATSNVPFMNRTTLVGNMEENDVLNRLNDQSFDRRADILEQLRITVRKNGGILPYANRMAIFRGLAMALGDSNWDVRHQCIQLINEVIPAFGEDLDQCMGLVLPRLVSNMGDSKITIRRSVIQTLHVYMKHANDMDQIFNAIVRHGLENNDPKIRKETIVTLPMLFTPEFSQENFFRITESLAKRLLDSQNKESNDALNPHVMLSMQKIKGLVGEQAFTGYIQKLSAPLRRYYYKLSEGEDSPTHRPRSETSPMSPYNKSTPSTPSSSFKPGIIQEPWISEHGRDVMASPISSHKGYSNNAESYDFGVIPSHVMDKLNDQSNFRTRAQAVEELKMIIQELDDVHALNPHVLQFISFLNNLLDDSNFKITTVTLEILALLVEKLGTGVKANLKHLVLALTKRMGDNKIVIRQAIMKVVIKLMQILSPKPVLGAISDNLTHRNSRVRQETLNIIIASLLTFPSYDFDLGALCQTIAHALVDSKRQVRQAALECFAVLAQAMGAGKLQPLVKAVDGVELSYEGDGVMAAVQARLAKRQLPKLNADGLVDYAAPIPSSASSRGSNVPHGADIDWIMAASGGAGTSARSTRSEAMDIVSVTSSARTTPADFITDIERTPRRHFSASKGKSRLPWEDDTDSIYSQNGHTHSDNQSNRENHPPVKQRATWASDQMGAVNTDRTANGIPRRRTMNSQTSRDHSPDQAVKTGFLPPILASPRESTYYTTQEKLNSNNNRKRDGGSYRQKYMNKYKRQISEGASQQYGTPRDEDDIPSALSTPRGSNRSGEDSARMNFSNSWPEPKMFEDTSKPAKKKLDPISGADTCVSPASSTATSSSNANTTTASAATTADWPDPPSDSTKHLSRSQEKSPIPTKATLARGASSKRKVPPIPIDRSPDTARTEEDYYIDSSRDSNVDDLDDMPDAEMMNSLRQIRHSANKKKVEKLWEKAENKLSRKSATPSPTNDPMVESGVFSNASNGRKIDSPFESRPRLARKNSLREAAKATETVDVDQRHLDFNPLGGVTFRPNANSDVVIVGRGYGEDSQIADPKPSMHATKAKDRRKAPPTKSVSSSSLLSPLAIASVDSLGKHLDLDLEEESTGPSGLVGKDETNVVDEGVFEPAASPTEYQGNALIPLTKERRSSRTDINPADLPRGVYGVGVKQNALEAQPSTEDEDEEDLGAISMSKTTREHMALKVQKQREEAEQRKIEAEERRAEMERQKVEREKQKRMEEEERKRKKEEDMNREKEKAQERLRRLSNQQEVEGLTISGSGNNGMSGGGGSGASTPTNNNRPSVGRPPVASKRKSKMNLDHSDYSSPPSAGSTRSEPDNLDRPMSNPAHALQDALKNVANEEWEVKCAALTHMRRIVSHSPEVMIPHLHAVTIAVLQEVKNLRSQVSRIGIQCLGEMFANLKKNMDTDLDQTTKVLLIKAGESNKFIQEDVDRTMQSMVDSVTPQRAMVAIIVGGASHKSVPIRRTASYFLTQVVERMGPGRVLSGVKDVTDRLLPIAAQFLLDGSPETRYNGQRILFMLMSHEDFDKMLNKYVSPNTLRNISDKLENLKKRGLGDRPSETPSARARKSGSGTRSGSVTRSNSASSTQGGDTTPTKPVGTPSVKRRQTSKMDEATAEEIKSIGTLLSANDWRERYKAIKQLEEMCESQLDIVGNNIVKIFDKFVPCLKDSNSKVNLFALQVMLNITPMLRDYLGQVANITIQTLSSNLSSKNKEIHDTASDILDSFMEQLDGSLLLQPFANQAQSGNVKIKPDMIDRTAFLATQVFQRKPKQVVLHVLPLLWHLLGAVTGSGGNSGALRASTGTLVQSLYSCMGQSLLDQASSNSNVNPKMKQLLEEMIDNP